jgi:probable rRNA maturation factor
MEAMNTILQAIEVQMASAVPDLPDETQMLRWADAVCRRFGTSGHEVCIRVVDAEEGRNLNRQYRGADKPTNVLSFAAEVDAPDIEVLGDIVICAPVVLSEAAAQGKTVTDHFAHMVIHGMCHLHGYDHEHEEEAQIMESLEVELLAGFGVANPYL